MTYPVLRVDVRPGRSRPAALACGLGLALTALACDRPEAGAPQKGTAPVPKEKAAASAKSSPIVYKSARPLPSSPKTAPRYKKLANMWLHPNPLPNFQLIDQDGKPFQLASLSQHYVLMGFIFTTCGNPKACPRTTQKMHDVARIWQRNAKQHAAAGRSLHLLTCTIDPDSDSPAVLKSYGAALRRSYAQWTFATGPEELMSEVLPGMFGVRRGKKKSATQMAHTVKVALLKPGLRPYREWLDNNFAPADVVKLVLD